ncbi:MAG: hypothetical protein LVS60_02815 [Nodosilinea sp. LVE1205-7]
MVMKLWLFCFLLIFFTVEGWQWLGHTLWFSQLDLSLPLVVGAGIGLAIASNLGHRQSSQSPPSPQAESLVVAADSSTEPGGDRPGSTIRPQPASSSPSISFEIPKPQGQRTRPGKN